MEISKASTLQLKALNKTNITEHVFNVHHVETYEFNKQLTHNVHLNMVLT